MEKSFKFYEVPSVYEINNQELRGVANKLEDGLRLLLDSDGYIVGNLALSEGVSPHRDINGSPESTDYSVLLKTGLVMGYKMLVGSKFPLTLGFPNTTFQPYRKIINDIFQTSQEISIDTSTYSTDGVKKLNIEVDTLNVIPEIESCALAIRSLKIGVNSQFVISLGYGTFEAILDTPTGVVQRSSISSFGIRYAVKLMEAELQKSHYLGLKNEHQLNAAFRDGKAVINRQRVDLMELRKKVLTQYYKDVISPNLKKAFTDNDFLKANKMFICGGGVNFPELVECFREEFDGMVEIIIPENAVFQASIGYCINSLKQNGGDYSKALGLDIGNSSIKITAFRNEDNV